MTRIKTLFFLAFVFLWGLFSFYLGTLKEKEDSSKELQAKAREIPGEASFYDGQNVRSISSIKEHIKKQWALKDTAFVDAISEMETPTSKKPLIVAVIDTGIHASHSCLKSNLWTNPGEIPGNNKDDDGNGFIDDVHGFNFVTHTGDIHDGHGHGTHISGIIAAKGNSSQSPNCRVLGFAPHVQIMTLKYFDEKNSNADNMNFTVKSIEYAVKNGAHIINYSGGGPGSNQEEESAIAKAADKGIIFVAALGNEGTTIGGHVNYYPASYNLPNIISVQNHNPQGSLVHSSNRFKIKPYDDKKVQTAPGENIISTLPPRLFLQTRSKEKRNRYLASFPSQDHYGYMTGTSQATAVVTGVTSLVKSRFPSWSMSRVIAQVVNTGFVEGTERIKEQTGQGKKINVPSVFYMKGSQVNAHDIEDSGSTSTLLYDSEDPKTIKTDEKSSSSSLEELIKVKEELKPKKKNQN